MPDADKQDIVYDYEGRFRMSGCGRCSGHSWQPHLPEHVPLGRDSLRTR